MDENKFVQRDGRVNVRELDKDVKNKQPGNVANNLNHHQNLGYHQKQTLSM